MTIQQIGPYKVVRQLGVGGCGVVYEAVHGQLGRRAAVKVLHGDIASDKEIATRFLNEARAISQVEHPGVVRVLEVGQQEDGAPFIALELLQGRSLHERLRELTYEEALRLVRQIASTLAAAHDRGIVHRDLKPENIMVVPDDDAPGGERAKVLDFGIAKLTDGYDGPGARALKTRTGITMGTPTYMSPEQCRGLRSIDGKSDVYSLGVMLYEMLGGRVPFSAKGDGEVMAMHVYREPPPLRELIPSLSGSVEALVHQMLGKAPERRPAMKEVADRLAQALAAAPPAAGGEVLHTRRELEVGVTVVAPATEPEPSTPREVRAVSPPQQAAAPPPSPSEAPTRLVLSSTPGLRPPPRPPAAATTTARAAAPPQAPWQHRGLVIGALAALLGAAAITHLLAGHLSGAADGAAGPAPPPASAATAAAAPAPPAASTATAAAAPASPTAPAAAAAPRAPAAPPPSPPAAAAAPPRVSKAPPRPKRPAPRAPRPAAPPGVIVD